MPILPPGPNGLSFPFWRSAEAKPALKLEHVDGALSPEENPWEEFTFLDEGSIEDDEDRFEVYDPPPDSVDDFQYVPDASGLKASAPRPIERALPATVVKKVDGTVGSVKSIFDTVINTPGLAAKASSAGFSAAREELMGSNPFDPRSYSPFTYLATIMAAGTATLVGAAAKTTQGVSDVDHEVTFRRAESYLRNNSSGLSQEQVATVKSWISEARRDLHDFCTKNYKSIGETLAAPESDSKDESDAKPSKKKAVRAPVLSAVPQTMTFKTLLRGAEEVSASMNPDAATLQKHAPELAALIQALEKVPQVPAAIHTTPPDVFYARLDADRMMGSKEFIDSLVTRGAILVDNALKPSSEQNKRVMIAISGPGTGKTTNIKKMATWTGQPLCMLTGEEFCKLPIPRDKDAFAVFEAWIKTRIMQHFIADGKGVINAILLLDDFHFALEGSGPFAQDYEARGKFFHFLKNLADANQESVISGITLAPGRTLPLNLVRTQIFITLNRLPKELADDGEEALTSRCININVAYPSLEDREGIAFNHTGADLRRAFKKRFEWTDEELEQRVNLETMRKSLVAVVKVDNDFAKTVDGQLGIRALSDLLGRYEQHVLKKLGDTKGEVDPEICSFSGVTPFDPAKVADEIKDYKKGRDDNLAKIEGKKALLRQVAEIKKACAPLPKVQAAAIHELLENIDDASAELQKITLSSAQRHLEQYTKRVELPEPADFGRALLQKFGYLKSSGADGEADRFDSIANVAKELYIRRAAAKTAGYRDNKIVRVRFTDPSAMDPSIYGDLAKILGGLPVHFLMNPDNLLSSRRAHTTVKLSDPFYQEVKNTINSRGSSMATFVPKGAFYAEWREEHVDGHAYFYIANRISTNPDGTQSFFVLNNAGIHNLMKTFTRSIDSTTLGVTLLNGRGTINEQLRRQIGPQLNMFEDFVEKIGDKASVAESFIVGVIDANVRSAMEKWRMAQLDLQPDKSSRDLFETHIYDLINKSTLKLSDGTCMDPRSLTVFLLDDPLGDSDPTGNGEAVTTMTLGIPPMEGRKTRAEYTLARELMKVKDDADKNLTLFGKRALEALALDNAEQAIFERLIAWDLALAKRAKEVSVVLPTSLLDQCVQTLVQRVGDRQTDYFGLNGASGLPNVAAFESEWADIYRDHTTNIDLAFEFRERMERHRIEAEAAQKKRDEEMEASRLRREKESLKTPASKTKRLSIPPPPRGLTRQESWSDAETQIPRYEEIAEAAEPAQTPSEPLQPPPIPPAQAPAAKSAATTPAAKVTKRQGRLTRESGQKR